MITSETTPPSFPTNPATAPLNRIPNTDDTAIDKVAPGTSADTWPRLSDAAHHGLAGEVVRAIEPHSESDPTAILAQYLAFVGSAVGRAPYYRVESDNHYSVLNVTLVGATSKARKGVSANRVLRILEAADPEWASTQVTSGLSTGEGLIKQVRDPVIDEGGKVIDPGVEDKRLLVLESEFGGMLSVMKRHGSLSRVLRDAWDGKDLKSMPKKDAMRATAPHISVVGHVTAHELRKNLNGLSISNGLANRFLFLCVKRSKLLPRGGNLDDAVVEQLGARTQEAIAAARKVSRVEMTANADHPGRAALRAA